MTSSKLRWSKASKAAVALTMVVSSLALAVAPSAGQDAEPAPQTPTTRIIGGTQAPAGAWPSQVGLLFSNEPDNFQAQFCAGTVLNRNWVLTAAHCVINRSASSIDILAGTQSLDSGGSRHRVAEIRIVSGYVDASKHRDVAVLRVRQPFPVAATNQAITSAGQAVPSGTSATVIGWGNTSTSGSSFPSELRQVDVTVRSDAQCGSGSSYGSSYISSSMMCASATGKDSCQGDSGGPLFIDGGDRQAGIVSWGVGCAQAAYPGVYTKVSAFTTWIQQQTRYGPHRTRDAYIDRTYLDLFNRAPSSSERASLGVNSSIGPWTSNLIMGTTNQNRAGGVTRLYSAFFLRNPDANGLSYWWRQINAGKSLYWIASVMAASSEFTNRYGPLTNAAYVDRVYENVLGRPGDAGGRAYWTRQLDLGTRSRGEVMVGFSESNEYKTKNTARVNVIITYFELLRRVPTAGEITADQGLSNQALVSRILSSYAYSNRFA